MDSKYSETVYAWFERCGIISNIRTHLRENLVNALRQKELSLKDYSSKPKAAKQYVYDFLIAEYLFNVNYAYTLSVFASEAPLLIQFDNDKIISFNSKEKLNKQKLQKDYIFHILETLGIKPNDPEGQYIISEYINNDAPLLLCILKYVSLCSININKTYNFQNPMSICTKETQTDACLERSVDLQRLMIAKEKIYQQKYIFDSQLKEKEMKLKQQTIIIEEQLLSLNEKLKKVQDLVHIATMKEQQLNEKKQKAEHLLFLKEIELSSKQNTFLLESERFQRKQDIYKNYERDLKKLQEELGRKKNVSSSYESKDIEMQLNSNHNLKENKNKDLSYNGKMKQLYKLLRDQQLKIDLLTQNSILLSHRLERIQQLRPTLIEDSSLMRKTININTIVSESSSTEDILQDAKLRLKRLEEESLKADRFYYNCLST